MDPLTPIDTIAPPGNIPQREHPVQPPSRDGEAPVPTNKFYTNMLLEAQTLPAWTQPYSMWMSKIDNFFGLAVSQTRADQRVFGPDPNQNPAQFYFNPAGIMSAVFSAGEFTKDNIALTMSEMSHLSATATISNGTGWIRAPLVMGMGLVSATYSKLRPFIQSQVGIRELTGANAPAQGVDKYSITLNDNSKWVMYVVTEGQAVTFRNVNGVLQADQSVENVTIQIGSCPNEADYDPCAGAWPVSADVSAKIQGDQGQYTIHYTGAGKSASGNMLIYAPPHMVAAFTGNMKGRMLGSRLVSTVMGQMVAVATTFLDMVETLPSNVGFMPWAQFANQDDSQFNGGAIGSVMDTLKRVAQEEANQDVNGQSLLDSMYFSGKGLDKFAFILVVIKYIIKDDELAKKLLGTLQSAFQVFVENRQQNPLAYDTVWKGLVSTAGLGGDANADFGNSFYNDHHFHYGYFIHAAAVIAKVDKEFGGNWLDQNKNYVNALLRDYCNPSKDDSFFPRFRSFDWFHGHSWAKGLFLSGDGKDEESSSEDYHSLYGMKLWGEVIGDQAMVGRANLMIAIERRSMNLYMLYSDGNNVEPAQFVGNRVSGILFQNKIDHATYFGANPEFIHGIHMIPITPMSSFVRGPDFVRQEWDSKIKDLVTNVDSGWKGILKLNQALFNPSASMDFFNDPNFQPQWLDGGMSRTWSLAFAAGVKQ